jgi:calcium-dependent protein kinase
MHMSKLEKEELLQQAFQQLDTDKSGTISIEELTSALKKFGIYDDAATLLATADKNGDGMIDYVSRLGLLYRVGYVAGCVHRRSNMPFACAVRPS